MFGDLGRRTAIKSLIQVWSEDLNSYWTPDVERSWRKLFDAILTEMYEGLKVVTSNAKQGGGGDDSKEGGRFQRLRRALSWFSSSKSEDNPKQSPHHHHHHHQQLSATSVANGHFEEQVDGSEEKQQQQTAAESTLNDGNDKERLRLDSVVRTNSSTPSVRATSSLDPIHE